MMHINDISQVSNIVQQTWWGTAGEVLISGVQTWPKPRLDRPAGGCKDPPDMGLLTDWRCVPQWDLYLAC